MTSSVGNQGEKRGKGLQTLYDSIVVMPERQRGKKLPRIHRNSGREKKVKVGEPPLASSALRDETIKVFSEGDEVQTKNEIHKGPSNKKQSELFWLSKDVLPSEGRLSQAPTKGNCNVTKVQKEGAKLRLAAPTKGQGTAPKDFGKKRFMGLEV